MAVNSVWVYKQYINNNKQQNFVLVNIIVKLLYSTIGTT